MLFVAQQRMLQTKMKAKHVVAVPQSICGKGKRFKFKQTLELIFFLKKNSFSSSTSNCFGVGEPVHSELPAQVRALYGTHSLHAPQISFASLLLTEAAIDAKKAKNDVESGHYMCQVRTFLSLSLSLSLSLFYLLFFISFFSENCLQKLLDMGVDEIYTYDLQAWLDFFAVRMASFADFCARASARLAAFSLPPQRYERAVIIDCDTGNLFDLAIQFF